MCFRYLLLICLLAPSVVNGQQLLQAPYSPVQASNGATLYQQNCATCHLSDLQGSFEAPALNDTNFRSNWTNRGVNELLDLFCRTNMLWYCFCIIPWRFAYHYIESQILQW